APPPLNIALIMLFFFSLAALPSSPLSLAQAQDTSALINEALDKPIQMQINTTLPQAIDQIGDKTGVRIVVQKAVWDLLPWGRDTNITAKIDNQTLRQALDAITRKLGLTFVLTDEAVELRPMPALRRLARRATVQELDDLDLLTSNPLGLTTDHPRVTELLSAIDQRLQQLKSSLAIDNRAGQIFTPDEIVPVARNSTIAEALESLATSTRATWYPWGKDIVIISKEDQVRDQLNKTITIRYNGVDLSQVLIELSQRAGVPFDVQPGSIQQINPEFRSIKLFLDDATIKQALDAISGFTGLAYSVNENGVYFWNNSTASASTTNTPARDPVIGIYQLDNGLQVLIPQSEVPNDMREYLKQKTQEELKKIRQQMDAEHFKPTSQPATQPTSMPTGNEQL
ncbi:MAG TPA: hypothetical protein VGG19_01490, partial [Tepidisphaeraceae bacterium]